MSDEPLEPIYHTSPVVMLLEGPDGNNYAEPVNNYIPLEVFAADKTVFNIIGATVRPGIAEFVTRLEHEHYRPGTAKNSRYRLTIVNWPQEDPMQFFVVGIPIEDRATAERLAAECGLRIADGVPLLLANGKEYWFPMQGENCWTLENVDGWTLANYKDKLTEERNRVEKIVEDSVALQKGKVNLDL